MTFASIGDCCVDIYPEKKILGGTAYNSALVARKYGAEVSILTAIGSDGNGESYKKSFKENTIDVSLVQQTVTPTSSVHVTLKDNSPIFGDWELGALEEWKISDDGLRFIKKHDVAKMICLKPLVSNFETFCQAKMSSTIKAGDFNGGSQYAFKPEEIERYIDGINIAVKSFDEDDPDAISFLQQLAKKKNKIILVTLGKKGSICFDNEKKYIQPVEKIITTNTTGFGDAFITVFLIEYFQTKDIQQSLYKATNAVANL